MYGGVKTQARVNQDRRSQSLKGGVRRQGEGRKGEGEREGGGVGKRAKLRGIRVRRTQARWERRGLQRGMNKHGRKKKEREEGETLRASRRPGGA